MNFAGAIPSTYYSLYILKLDGTPFIIGIIEFAAFLALASVQFPGGYLADKVGRRGLIVTFTFGITFANLFFIFCQVLAFHPCRNHSSKRLSTIPASLVRNHC
jgi:MFS family permease